jgi:hypothetical protein
MPDPKECRCHAANCRWLATEALSVWGRHTLLHIADCWDQIAVELELEEAEPSSKATSGVILPFRLQENERRPR